MNRIRTVAIGLVALLAPALAGSGQASADQRGISTNSAQAINNVVQRALSQQGVPFVYGGGSTSGPTTAARPSAGTIPGALTAAPNTALSPGSFLAPGLELTPAATTVGFDASGLIQYAFAGAGIKMPRTSGQQCSVGSRVPPEQARAGDLLCYGQGGTQSVALYLGNGQMIEGTNPVVTVSPARTSNMMPYLTRVITG
ncbi:MAG: NlpC/P60 family peptidoglycan-binding protein RipD [Mycobacterium sp.]